MQALTALPAEKRPRERCRIYGPQSLSLEELIAIILGSGVRGHPVTELSERVSQLLLRGKWSVQELQTIPGIGSARAVQLAAALHLVASIEQQTEKIPLTQPENIYQRMEDLVQLPQEHCAVFCMSVRHHEVVREVISVGTTTSTLIHPREVYRPAINSNAVHIVLAHTHPSGDPSPSSADLEVTRNLSAAGNLLGITLIDHVVCARQGFVSLRKEYPELFS